MQMVSGALGSLGVKDWGEKKASEILCICFSSSPCSVCKKSCRIRSQAVTSRFQGFRLMMVDAGFTKVSMQPCKQMLKNPTLDLKP